MEWIFKKIGDDKFAASVRDNSCIPEAVNSLCRTARPGVLLWLYIWAIKQIFLSILDIKVDLNARIDSTYIGHSGH